VQREGLGAFPPLPAAANPMLNSLNGHSWPYLTYDPNDDRDGFWTREQLEEMNERFVAALEVAFQLGQECRSSASAEFGGISNGSAALARQRSCWIGASKLSRSPTGTSSLPYISCASSQRWAGS
jgi:hypothetical protein